MNKFFYLCLIFCLIFCSGCVSSNKINTLENRIISLEIAKDRQLQNDRAREKIIEELKKNGDSANRNYAALKAELRSYRASIQRLRGVIEETGHKFKILDNKDMSKENDKKIEELNNKFHRISKHITELEQYIGLESSKNLLSNDSTPKKNMDTSDVQDIQDNNHEIVKNINIGLRGKNETPEDVYKRAKSFLDKGKYDSSRLEFEKFINLFPDSKNADNARFWIAETYYREKWFEKSILEYQKVIEKYSTGNKVAAALLKQGYSFAALGEKANSRLILKELIKKYPDSKEAAFAKKKLESIK